MGVNTDPANGLFDDPHGIAVDSNDEVYISEFGNNRIQKFSSSPAPVTSPVTSFSVNTTSGTAPLTVKFTDTSSHIPTAWSWSFRNVTPGNNTQVVFSTQQNPTHTFGVGNYSIVLTASNSAGSDISDQITFINVSALILRPVASFTPDVMSETAPLEVTFTDHSTNTPTAWNWSFRNVTPGNNTQVWFSTVQSPTHTFGVGNYSIVLNASNSAGYNLSTQVTFINVTSRVSSKIGVFRPSSGIWSLDSNGNFAWEGSDKSLSWGLPNDIPVLGDWNADGKDDIGIFRPSSGIWSLDSNGNFAWEGSDKSLSGTTRRYPGCR